MKLNLVVDRGNTATKATLYDGNVMVATTASLNPEEAVANVLKPGVEIGAAIFSTVGRGGDEAMSFLADYAPRVFSLSTVENLPIIIRPEWRHLLGGDRIAAAAGAWCKLPRRNILVVDSGTAVTYDVVTSDGRFLGGNIAPGIKMCLDAMHRDTALLPQLAVPDSVGEDLLGQDTYSAMINGVVYGIVGAIESLAARLGDDTGIVLTGGNSRLFAPLLRVDAVMEPHLVTDGLNAILNLNL